MSLTFPFKTVGFFNQHEGRTGNMAGHMTPDPSGGSIVFDQPLGSLPRAICVAGNEAGGGYFAMFPAINTFPDEEFSEVIVGKYLEDVDAPAGTMPYMMLMGTAGKCVGIQVGIKHG